MKVLDLYPILKHLDKDVALSINEAEDKIYIKLKDLMVSKVYSSLQVVALDIDAIMINLKVTTKEDNLYKHIKTGRTYRVLNEAVLERDLTKVIVYQDIEDDYKIWVRSYDEFHDGRFEKI